MVLVQILIYYIDYNLIFIVCQKNRTYTSIYKFYFLYTINNYYIINLQTNILLKVNYFSSKFSKATLTASITNAVKVQLLPSIAFSTFSIISLGKRIHLLVVGGIDGILNFFIVSPRNAIIFIIIYIVCITYVLHKLKIYIIIHNEKILRKGIFMEETKKKSSLSTAGMVLGIIAICLCWIPILNYISFILGILAIIFGLIGIIKNKGRGIAIAGLILGLISIYMIYNMYWAVGKALNEINDTISDVTGVSTANSTESNETHIISAGEVITGKDVEITIESADFNQKVEPPVKNIYYNYYQVDDSNNTYLYIILNCKNTSTIDLTASSVANVTVKYNNSYTYSSFSAIPDDTLGFTYTNLTNIKPLTSQKIYYLAEMPKSIADEADTPVEINIKVDNTTYTYQYR